MGYMKNHIIVSLKRNVSDDASFLRRTASATTLILLSATLAPRAHAATQYVQHNLVSDIPGIADQTDPNLVNPWGISMSSTTPFGNGRGAGDAKTFISRPAYRARAILKITGCSAVSR